MQTFRLTPPLFEDNAELALVRLAVDLGAAAEGQVMSVAERDLVASALALARSDALLLETTRAGILDGADPLGAMLTRVRPADQRRSLGAFYTPPALVNSMVEWVLTRRPDRLVDAGCGSGRFAAAMHDLDCGRPVPRSALAAAPRWSGLVRATENGTEREGTVPLGSMVSVHRGLVTGANDYFVLDRQRARDLGLLPWCRPAITDAQEILQADGVLRDTPRRKMLLSVPRDIDRTAYPALDAYLRLGEAERDGHPAVALRYIASHRKPWWYLGQPSPPPLVATYMARQAPAFALNPDGLALINIGHGLYPKGNLPGEQLATLCNYLNTARHTFRGQGRTYQGGLEKFEPREMEALQIDPTLLNDA